MGVAAIHSLNTAADLSDPAHPHSYTNTHTMAWDLLTQAIFSPCPQALSSSSPSKHELSFKDNNEQKPEAGMFKGSLRTFPQFHEQTHQYQAGRLLSTHV